MTGPFAEHAIEYHRRGWNPIPVLLDDKHPALSGVTGRHGVNLTRQQIIANLPLYGHMNIGLRMSTDMIGIDIDQRGKKVGHDRMLAFQAKHGLSDLPLTAFVSSKGSRG